MRKYVFATADGGTPDLRFVAENVSCPVPDRVATCAVAGQLEIRGTARPFDIALRIAREGDTFRIVGEGVVKLSAYGIPPPSQLGVHTEDAVKLHLECSAAPSADAVSAGGVK
jgi:hypothetical protein